MHHNAHRSSQSRCAFTLVELLVVIAIIALLISILLPSLARAREQAKSVRCLANMKDIASGMNGYASDDPNENMIPVLWRGLDYFEAPRIPYGYTFVGYSEWGGKGGSPDVSTSDYFRYRLQFASYYNHGPGDRPLNKYLYKGIENSEGVSGSGGGGIDDFYRRARSDNKIELNAFQCPSDIGWPRDQTGIGIYDMAKVAFAWDPEVPHYTTMGNSYRATILWAALEGLARGEGFNDDEIYTVSTYMRPASQVPLPSRVVLTTEGNAYLTDIWNRGDQESTAENAVRFGGGNTPDQFYATGWHGKFQTFNASFADGHAGQISQDITTDVDLAQLWPPDSWVGSGATDFPRGSNLRVGSRPEWINTPTDNAAAYASGMVRGDGWQYDCLPSPPVLAMQPNNIE